MDRWYRAASVFFLLQTFLATSVVLRLVYGEWDGAGSNKIAQGLNLILLTVSVALFAHGFRAAKRIGTGGLLAIGLSGFLFASMLWSVDPDTTVRRSVLYLFFVLGVNGMANTLRSEEFIDILGAVCLLSLIVSVALFAISPAAVIMRLEAPDDPIALRGVFSHKNVFGQVMVCGALASLHKIRAGRQLRLSAAMLAAFAVGTVASRSGTSLVIVMLLSFASLVVHLVRRRGIYRKIAIGMALAAAPLAAAVALFPDVFLESMGKDPTLTGRTVLWAFVIDDIAQRPVLGWGFDAFWSLANRAAVEISDNLKWLVPEAHNGILELLLEVGAIGTAMFVGLWVRNIVLAWRCLHTAARELAVTSLLCCGWIFFTGMTEKVLVDPSWPSGTVFFATGMFCETSLRKTRRERVRASVTVS